MPRMKVHPLCGWAALRCLLVLMLLATDAPGKPLWAQSAGSAPTYQSCASSAVGLAPFQGSFPEVEQTLTALYKPAAGSTVMLSAHRGFWQNAPENSMSAIYDAVRHKFPISEVDIYQTANNGTVVLSHDNDVARTTTGTGQVTSMTAASYVGLYLRDRHGCPTNEHPVALTGALNDLFVNQQVYYDPTDDEVYGEVTILDIKASTAAAMYQTLLEAITEWDDTPLSNFGVSPSVVFKVPMYVGGTAVMPTPSQCNAANHCGYEKFIDDIHAKTGGPPVNPNMIYVLYAPNSSDPSDSYFQDYDAQPWSYGNGGTLGFETHERYSNDQLTPMRMYLQKEGRAVGGFSADDMFPEGEPYLNICCTYFNLDLTSPPQPGCLTAGFQKCFDERVRWDYQVKTVGVGLLTLERPGDASNYLLGLSAPSPSSSADSTAAPPADTAVATPAQ